MRSDQHTVNGLTAYKLLTSRSASSLSHQISSYDGNVYVVQYFAVDVAKRAQDGTETPLGSKVASASGNASALLFGSWAISLTSVEPTDAIVVRIYGQDVSPPTYLVDTFITDQVQNWASPAPTQLDNVQWTLYYYLLRTAIRQGGLWITDYFFNFGISTYDSKVDNFTYSLGGGPPPSAAETRGDGLAWVMT